MRKIVRTTVCRLIDVGPSEHALPGMGCSLPAVVDRACRRRHIATVTCLADRHLSGADPVLRLKSVPKARDLGP